MTPERVQRTYLILLLLQTLAASLIWGINTLFLLDAGLTITQAFIANAAFTAGMVIFEVPTGVIADTFGRRTSFILGAATLLVTTAAYLWLWYVEAGIGWWILVSALIGLGFTFFSGATEAWLVDALTATGFEGEIVWDESRPDGQPRRALDVSRAERGFGFRAEVPLDEGIRRTVAYYREHLAAAPA